MFTFAQYCFRRIVLSGHSLSVFILGLDGSGYDFINVYRIVLTGYISKTCLLNELKRLYEQKDPVSVIPTIGKNTCRFKEKGIEYDFQDVGGSPSLRVYWNKYFKEIDAVLYVIDGTSNEQQIQDSYGELLKLISDSDLEGVPICICINKMDMSQQHNGVLSSKDTFENKYNIQADIGTDRCYTIVETVFSSPEEHRYWKKKREATRFGAQSKEQLLEEEEEKSNFPFHIHKGSQEIIQFLDNCCRTDSRTKKRCAQTKKHKSNKRR
jgi:small GTP-binding protein